MAATKKTLDESIKVIDPNEMKRFGSEAIESIISRNDAKERPETTRKIGEICDLIEEKVIATSKEYEIDDLPELHTVLTDAVKEQFKSNRPLKQFLDEVIRTIIAKGYRAREVTKKTVQTKQPTQKKSAEEPGNDVPQLTQGIKKAVLGRPNVHLIPRSELEKLKPALAVTPLPAAYGSDTQFEGPGQSAPMIQSSSKPTALVPPEKEHAPMIVRKSADVVQIKKEQVQFQPEVYVGRRRTSTPPPELNEETGIQVTITHGGKKVDVQIHVQNPPCPETFSAQNSINNHNETLKTLDEKSRTSLKLIDPKHEDEIVPNLQWIIGRHARIANEMTAADNIEQYRINVKPGQVVALVQTDKPNRWWAVAIDVSSLEESNQ